MGNWELIYVTDALCDECSELMTCNIYRTPFTCECLKCKGMGNTKYRYRNICGSCLGKFLKTQYTEVDYAD